MSGITHFSTFLIAGILLNLTPGNDTMYILSQSIARGRTAGIFSALGIGTGIIIHTVFAALGLSLVIARSIVLFAAIKYVGAAYLVYLGIRMFLNKSGPRTNDGASVRSADHLKTYRDAVLTNLFNPKVALFFIAFLPQFIDPHQERTVVPFLVLGCTFVCTGTVWSLVLATFSASLSRRLRSNTKITSLLNKLCGTVLLGLGAKIAFARAK